MIDDKKIEEAAKQHSEESYISGYFQACYKDAFIDSAKWMQEEFLKDLWHPASEEPDKNHFVLFKTAGNSFETEYILAKMTGLQSLDVLRLLSGSMLMICFQRKEVSNERA